MIGNNDLHIEIGFYEKERVIREAVIRITSDVPDLSRYIAIEVQNDNFDPSFFEDFSSLPTNIKSFIDYFKHYSYNLSRREGNGTIVLSTPLDHYFFSGLFSFRLSILLEENINIPSFINPKNRELKLLYDGASEKIWLPTSEKGSLLRTNAGIYIVDNDGFSPVTSIFNPELVETLFAEEQAPIEEDLKMRLLQKKRENSDYIERFLKLPDVTEFSDYKIVFMFDMNKGKYSLTAFFEVGKKNKVHKYPFNFSEIRKKTILSEDIILHLSDDNIGVIPASNPFYDKVRIVVNEVFTNFFEFLEEIQENVIATQDKDNLFGKFLPKVDGLIELHDENSPLKLVHGDFSQNNIILNEPEDINGDGRIEWLEVKFEFKIKNIKLNLTELKKILKTGFIKKEGKIITADEKEMNMVRGIFEEIGLKQTGERWHIRRFDILRLMREKIKPILPHSLRGLTKELESVQSVKKVAVPTPSVGTLRDYQKMGVYWLAFLNRYHFSGILADEMGLGKTLQVLTFLRSIQGQGPVLIVCPTSLVYNWVDEIEKFFPGKLSFRVIIGAPKRREESIAGMKDNDIAITSYALAHMDREAYGKILFNYCILDEAQHIKNKAAKRTRSIKGIRSRHRIAITGTPLENNITELWSIFDFLMPGFLGNHRWFRTNFEQPIEGFNRIERSMAFDKLKKLTGAFILRRTKSIVYKELPDKIEQNVTLDLTEKQKAIYLDTLSRVRNHYFDILEKKGFEKSYIDFLAALTRLRQICLHPALVNRDLAQEIDSNYSTKLTALLELLQEAMDSGHRVLIFSQFVQMLKLIRRELTSEGIDYFYLDGETKNRVELVKQFNTSKVPVFLISLRAGGTGLNLVGADSVILFDPWWNPAVENQAIDRAHRIGQTKTVNVYRLITRGTIEEKIMKLQTKKKNVFDSIMEKDDTFIRKMTVEDVKTLFEQVTEEE